MTVRMACFIFVLFNFFDVYVINVSSMKTFKNNHLIIR